MRWLQVAVAGWVVSGCGGATTSRRPVDASSDSQPSDVSNDVLSDVSNGVPGEVVDAPGDSMTGIDATSCMILESNYNQSCTYDNDCLVVATGDYCVSRCFSGNGAISAAGLAQFNADVAKTPAGSGAIPPGGCPPGPNIGNPCCVSGVCRVGPSCYSLTPD
jgi:hypothetical protein